MQPALLDTDILSEVLKQKNAAVVERASDYLAQGQQFALSAITWYEIVRGLKHKRATRQLKNFEQFCGNCVVLPISEAVLERAAELWVAGERGGHPHRDADLIIAATALENGRVLVTGNTGHFGWVTGLTVEDWRTS